MCGVDVNNLDFTERRKVYNGQKNVTKKMLTL